MQDIERQVWREARAMTRREVITKAVTRQFLAGFKRARFWRIISHGCCRYPFIDAGMRFRWTKSNEINF